GEGGAAAEVALELPRGAEGGGTPQSAGEAYVRAAVCFHFSKFVWVVDDALHREHTLRSIDALARAHALLDPTAERVEVPLDGATMAANLRRPDGVDRPPLVVLIPGLDSTKEEFFHWEQTKRIADEAPGGRFVLYDEGSHVCNNMPYRYRPLVADWMLAQLTGSREPATAAA